MRLALLCGLTCLAPQAGGHATELQDPTEAQAPPTRLVVVISVDSLIPEQLERLRPWWQGGFKRLLEGGAHFTGAQLPYAFSDSSAGVASLATGCLPRIHGIVKDVFYDRELRRQRHCVSDREAHTVSSFDWKLAESSSASSRELLVPGMAEALRQRWPASRSVSIGGKGQSAVLLAGKQPNLALWWDSYGRGFVSSSAYTLALPEWLAQWNMDWAERYRDWSWTADLPAAAALMQTGADERAGEGYLGGQPAVFPYLATQLPAVLEPKHRAHLAGRAFYSPMIDEVTVDLATQAVSREALGADDDVDLLCVSFSACGFLVEVTGPYSVEVTDALLRLDRELGTLFDGLDEQVGEGAWALVLASDRGVLELPEGSPGSESLGVRLPVRARRMALEDLRQALRAEFEEDFGVMISAPGDEVLFTSMSDEADAGEVGTRARELAARTLRELPWVAGAHTREVLLAEPGPEDSSWLRWSRGSYGAGRGADVVVRIAHRHLIARRMGTTGGTPYLYDRRQSLLFYGSGFEAGAYNEPASSVDALPTILHSLGVTPPEHVDGRPLLVN